MSDNTNSTMEPETEKVEETEASVTLLEVLELQKELEEESAAVLGGSDEKECTYEKGYIKRQALYSCLTCCPEGRTNVSKAIGICLACSYQCHENHDLIELYTKRNFRCDCPTERIPNKKCSFLKDSFNNIAENTDNTKYPENKENTYNHNFSGVYCICEKPYPDPDDPIQDEMLQCAICEDWYHTRHLDCTTIPKHNEYSEMICGSCMQKYDFLKDYTGYAIGSDDVNVLSEGEDDKLKSELDKSISDIMSISKNSTEETRNDNKSGDGSSSSRNIDEPPIKKMKITNNKTNEEICKRPIDKISYKKGGVFWTNNWRRNLCTCSKCYKMYISLKIDYLLDKEDPVHFYEENGLKKLNENENEKIIRAMSSMSSVQQIEAITEYNRMKDKLMEYLRTFVVNQRVVTEADIHEFFEKMKKEKNNLGIPYFCR